MCGIFGFAKAERALNGLQRFKLQGVVMDLLILNESRGRDGSGIYLASRRETVLFKEAKPASELLRTKRLKKLIRRISDETAILLGHTRLATVGEVSSKNCHPFLSKDFAGVHNGHFLNRRLLLESYARNQETSVDSEAIFRVLDGEDKREGIAKRLSEMTGDFALAFLRKDAPYVLYLIRNEGKPLHVAYVTSLRALFWSSDIRHLEYALSRNFLKAVLWEIKPDALYEIDARRFGKKWCVRKTNCTIENPVIPYSRFSGIDSELPASPYLYTYDEVRHMGYLEHSNLNELSKLPCSECEETVEAGKLFYDELTGGSFCESCSFDYFERFDPQEGNRLNETSGEQYQLF